MSIYVSSNPTDWGQLDGIYIDETSPPPSVTGVPANTAILVGQFERGPGTMEIVGSTGQLFQLFGNNNNYSGNVALLNKRFGLLKVIRAIASDAANAAKTFQHSSTDIITFTALWAGAYGNNIKVTIAAGSTSGSKYTVHDNNPGAVWPDEVYDNVVITAISAASNPFAKSNLVSATVVATSNEPDTAAATSLASGTDGTIADTDYQPAVALSQVTGAGNILFLDEYSTTRSGYLKTSMAATTDKMTVMNGPSGNSVGDAVTDVASYRDSDGRIIYAFPYLYTNVGGTSTLVPSASFYAALLSQISPAIDPAYAANVQFLSGVDALELPSLGRSDYITLAAAGISAFEFDPDEGFKVKSGVVTQIADSSKIMIFRRRMTDYIQQSLAKFLKSFQNGLNSQDAANSEGAGIIAFNRLLELSGLVPKDSEVSGGKASLVDVNSLNTDDSIALGYRKIKYLRRIYSSQRYIVLQTEIGESVVVTEASS